MRTKYLMTILALLPIILWGTVYEDAENQNIQGWRIYDNSGENGNITNQYDTNKKSYVINLQGNGEKNGYILGDFSGNNAWNNQTEKKLQWSMNFSSNFTIYIRINTSYGLKYLYYTPVTYNLGRQSQNRYIHHGLGLDAKNGSWRTFSRDLEADLQEFEPGNKILSVLGFLVRGGGKIDDIQLLSQNEHNQNIFEDPVSNIPPQVNAGKDSSINIDNSMDIIGSASDTDGSIVTYEWREDNTQELLATTASFQYHAQKEGIYHLTLTVKDDEGATAKDTRTLIVTNNQEPNIKDYTLYEDASDGNTQGWRVYDNTSPGATISNIYSLTKKNNVIQLKGDSSKNAYILGGFGGNQAWNNTTQKNLKWSISSNEFFTIYIRINTTKGYKYLCYTPVDTDLGSISQNRYIHHALGANIINGLWSTYTRDLEADLQEFDSDNKLISILGFLVRGSVLVDDIQLFNPQQNNIYEQVVEEQVVESNDTLNNKLTQIQKLLSDSANNLNHNVDYIIAGDSTRALVGNEMINYYDEQFSKINVTIFNNAISGQTAQAWINNRGSFTHMHAINLTKNLGENTILEYSLGINDTARFTKAQIKSSITRGIQTYLTAKPKAHVFLVTPIVIGNITATNTLKEIYLELSNELNLPLIDTQVATAGVHGDSRYYRESIHPTRFGSRRILNYITNALLPKTLHNQMTLEEHPDRNALDWMSIDIINEGLNITLKKI